MWKTNADSNLPGARRVSRSVRIVSALVVLAPLLMVGSLWVRARLRQEADLRAKQRQDALNQKLIVALLNDDVRQALALVQAGADPNAHYTSHLTAFLLACQADWRQRKDSYSHLQASARSSDARLDDARLARAMLNRGGSANAPIIREESASAFRVIVPLGASRNAENERQENFSAFYSYPLIMAAAAGNRDMAQALIAHGAALDARDCLGRTALIAAACVDTHRNAADMPLTIPARQAQRRRQSDIARLLLTAGADAQAADAEGETALTHAIERNNTDMVLQLLAGGANPNAQCGRKHDTALARAAADDDLDAMRALLQYGAKTDLPGAESPLLRTSDTATLTLLLARGADIHARSHDEEHRGETVLIRAARKGNAHVARFLLARGADVNETDAQGKTALALAASEGNRKMLRFLLDHGAKVNMPRCPVLLMSLENEHHDAARLLLRRGAGGNVADESGTTPLMRAVGLEDKAFVRELLRQGARVNARDEYGRTALYVAAQDNNSTMIALLLAWGAKVNTSDKKGYTPLDLTEATETHIPVRMRARARQENARCRALLERAGAE